MRPKVPDDVPRRFRKPLEAPDVFAGDAPVYPDREDGPTFPLAFTHSGASVGRPVLVIVPGGPGFASVAPYATIEALPSTSPRRSEVSTCRAFGAYLAARELLARPAVRRAGVSVTLAVALAAALWLLACYRRPGA